MSTGLHRDRECVSRPVGEEDRVAIAASHRCFESILLGTAIGDALGLPAENMSPRRIRRWWDGRWRMRFVFGHGMISDDTEHTLMVAQALLEEPDDAARFQRALARRLRWWFAALPAGVGLATARACLRLWLGFPAHKCAVNSAGSGPAMRSAILGAYLATEPEQRRAFVLQCTRLTHRSWQAETAALAVAEIAAISVTRSTHADPPAILAGLRNLSSEAEWLACLDLMKVALSKGASVADYACSLGLGQGVTGYSLHVVPVAIYSFLRHRDDFRTALVSALDCGGDTDTVGAILGALCGSQIDADIPKDWTFALRDWPCSTAFMRRIAQRLMEQKAEGRPLGPVPSCWPALLLRNLVFLVIVLLHGLRRLLPPF